MSKKPRKTISKETQEAIKKFLTSNVSIRSVCSVHTMFDCILFLCISNLNIIFFSLKIKQISPSTPTIELDANFSMILKKKREEQLEASKQRLFDSTSSKGESLIETIEPEHTNERIETPRCKTKAIPELENSMMFCKANKSWHDLSVSDDSFLALERQCNMDDKRDRLINANDTLLFDVEPPSELWNQTINQSIAATQLEQVQEEEEDDDDDTIEISPVKYIGLIRPSTIIEETSSQMESSSKNTIYSNNSSNNSLPTKSSLYATASTNDSFKDLSASSCDTSNDSKSDKTGPTVTPLRQQSSKMKKIERQRRGTFAFKRANYTFFPDDHLGCINESVQSNDENIEPAETPKKHDLLNFQTTPKSPSDEPDEDQFNNTLERVDYLLEKGKQIVEETPVSKRNSHHQSFLETPLFSCKRKRLLSEMASIEMLPLPKRGPLIDFSTPEITKQIRVSKFSGK